MPNPAVIVNVDDNEPSRYAKHRILESAGYRVYDAATGQSALDLAQHYKPALVLCDVHLPDINGLEVCKRLKSGPQAASILVLQISASDLTGKHVRTALNNGADGYLTGAGRSGRPGVDGCVLAASARGGDGACEYESASRKR